MRPLVAHCHLGFGAFARKTGRKEQAQEHLTTATAMYSEMDMRFWLEKGETEFNAVVALSPSELERARAGRSSDTPTKSWRQPSSRRILPTRQAQD